MELPEKIRCSRCGQVKPIEEMNGYDPITGDVSRAHCRRLAECGGEEVEVMWDELVEAMGLEA